MQIPIINRIRSVPAAVRSPRLAAFAVAGAQIGTWLLARLPQNAVRWGFIAFLVFVIVMLFVVVPSRDAQLDLTWGSGLGLAILGVITGTLAGLLISRPTPDVAMLFGLVTFALALIVLRMTQVSGAQTDPRIGR